MSPKSQRTPTQRVPSADAHLKSMSEEDLEFLIGRWGMRAGLHLHQALSGASRGGARRAARAVRRRRELEALLRARRA